MSNRVDKKTEEALMKVIQGFQALSQELYESEEKGLWKEVHLPCSLFDAIHGLTKDEMVQIRQKYMFKNLSTLKKAELASELARLIPLNFKKVLYTLDQSRYDLIKKIMNNSGFIPDFGISHSNAKALRRFSLVFTGLYENRKILFMPVELMDVFCQIDGSELQSIVRRNTEWIRLTHGLLYYYGVADIMIIQDKIKEVTGQKPGFKEFMDVFSFACDFYGQASLTLYGYQDNRVFDAKKIADEHRARPRVDYYSFTKAQLLKAGEPGYFDRTPEMNRFIGFLKKYYDLSEKEINEIALEIINIINNDIKPLRIFDYLQEILEFPSFEFLQELAEKITALCNNTRQWALKGHTPNELFQEERKALKPLPGEPFKMGQPNSKVIEVTIRTKVGRNDPCPCGSGKKYKKCCGRTERPLS